MKRKNNINLKYLKKADLSRILIHLKMTLSEMLNAKIKKKKKLMQKEITR